MEKRLRFDKIPTSLRAVFLALLVFAGLALVVYIIAPNQSDPVQPAATAAMDLAPILPQNAQSASAEKAIPEEKTAPDAPAPSQMAQKTAPEKVTPEKATEPAVKSNAGSKTPPRTLPSKAVKSQSRVHRQAKSQPKSRSIAHRPAKKATKPAKQSPVQTASVAQAGAKGYQILFESDEALSHLVRSGDVTRYLRRTYPIPTYWLVMDESKDAPTYFKKEKAPSVVEVPQSQVQKLHAQGLYQIRKGDGQLSDHVVSLSPQLNQRLASLVEDQNLSKERSILMIKGNGDVEVVLARQAG